MYVEYKVTSDEPFHDVESVITFGLIELEANIAEELGLDIDRHEEISYCNKHITLQETSGVIRLCLYDVSDGWRPSQPYEQRFLEAMRREGCTLELVA